ncbi:uncharacterized protein LOC106143579 isoform X2 [Amyelois transitella]|uniref:uncharacterized protein LOC106143579 isoform X2 n=1 Tax=Amyelois transitella TaxID=680683 RepID=UPI00298FC332|nr:uncharacterized protein LOC106143579 isoform X2 [Amyelois transitella]
MFVQSFYRIYKNLSFRSHDVWIFASPRVKHVSKSQAITRNNTKNAKTGHKKIVRNDYNFEDDGSVNKNTDGDTFTARELLPVAQKLFEKEGKGIVSSSKRPQDLADKLFQGFFMTSSRIVRLKDEDIKGLDALQRLALVGDPVLIKRIRNKAIKKKEPKKAKAKRRGNVKLINKLGRNRHLIVQRKNMNDTRKTSQNMAPCHWSYECKDPADLDSCQLQAKCIERKPNQRIDHSQYIKNNLEIDPNIVAQFRRALSITALDEEVEKIPSSEKIESLSEYFRKIVDAELNGEAITKSVTEDSNDYGDVYADDQITVKPGNKNIAEKPQVVKLDAASDNDQVVKGRQNITALDLGHRAVATILG